MHTQVLASSQAQGFANVDEAAKVVASKPGERCHSSMQFMGKIWSTTKPIANVTVKVVDFQWRTRRFVWFAGVCGVVCFF
jgi:hypothetical protein